MQTHGDAHKERLYEIWKNMRRRCNNENDPAYHNYGGRGITVCSEWDSYLNFKEWAQANGYDSHLTIDRIDVNQGYTPENCRWATRKTQNNNRRDNRIVEYNGSNYTLAQLAEIANLPASTLYNRLFVLRWDIDRAVTTPSRSRTKEL